MRQGTKEWLKQAQYDLETAEIMYKGSRYVYTVFMCHLAVEKALKALFTERAGIVPPRIHNLIKLAKITRANLNENQIEFISTLNMAGIGTRYPELLDEAIKKYPQNITLDYLNKTREVIQCLKKNPRLKE